MSGDPGISEFVQIALGQIPVPQGDQLFDGILSKLECVTSKESAGDAEMPVGSSAAGVEKNIQTIFEPVGEQGAVRCLHLHTLR